MNQTAIYIAPENCLQEISQMEQPEIMQKNDLYSSDYHPEVAAYNAHLATLRKIPCSPEPEFKDGEKYTEGVDYEIKGAGDWKWCCQLKGNVFAAPLVPEGEDELWKEMLIVINKGIANLKLDFEIIAELKQKYLPPTKR